MQYGNWEVIRPLGKEGGQGAAFLVTDIDHLQLSTLPTVLSNTIAALGGVGYADTKAGNALGLLQLIERYIQRESDPFCFVLKLLHASGRQNPKALARLRREVEILRQLDHPNLLKIIDASVEEGWYVTPYYREGTLAEHLHRFAGRPQEALEAFRGLVDGVVQFHDRLPPVVHRDIKPENIFVSGSRLVLGDFGIVYFQDEAKTRLTDTYENVGSRDWMPGWAMGMQVEEVQPSFDVFSLGKVLWTMVSGRTKMRLWYYNDPAFDLTHQFPDDERMRWINRLLQGAIQEHEKPVWPAADVLRAQVDKVCAILRRGGQAVGREVTRWCRVCGAGQYHMVISEEDHWSVAKKYGLMLNGDGVTGKGQFRILECTECRHVELFRTS